MNNIAQNSYVKHKIFKLILTIASPCIFNRVAWFAGHARDPRTPFCFEIYEDSK